MTIPTPAPHVGQLRTGEWCVFNMSGTDLWNLTFPTRASAMRALLRYGIQKKLREGETG